MLGNIIFFSRTALLVFACCPNQPIVCRTIRVGITRRHSRPFFFNCPHEGVTLSSTLSKIIPRHSFGRPSVCLPIDFRQRFLTNRVFLRQYPVLFLSGFLFIRDLFSRAPPHFLRFLLVLVHSPCSTPNVSEFHKKANPEPEVFTFLKRIR